MDMEEWSSTRRSLEAIWVRVLSEAFPQERAISARHDGMAESEVFDFVCEQLEKHTTLDRLESRGTVRITLKDAGLDAETVNVEQMAVAVLRLLPTHLDSRGVRDGERHCQTIEEGLHILEVDVMADTPDGVFQRFGG